MLTQTFCEFLEFELCKAFSLSDNDQIKGFWCDGVLLDQPENAYSQQAVLDNKQVKLKAYIGKDGQTPYKLTLKFGNEALNRVALNQVFAKPRPTQLVPY
ncbi:MAG: hypothetical protein JNJ57_22260 [Saprospiraceae bacterium]|nr:hypothetical protein [Saprospiraceae bacterium]